MIQIVHTPEARNPSIPVTPPNIDQNMSTNPDVGARSEGIKPLMD
jgi:hypothetical protein